MGTPTRANREPYTEACGQLVSLLSALSDLRRDRYAETAWIIEQRVKTEDSIRKKLTRKQAARPGYSIADLTDIAGVRVLVDGMSTALALGEFFRKRRPFDVQQTHSEDFQDIPRADGYRATHIVVSVDSRMVHRVVPVEIQIRTMLQHQWALLSNSEFYKSVGEIPPSLLARMRALSEILHAADIEADQLRRNRILDDVLRRIGQSTRENIVERLREPMDPTAVRNTGLLLVAVLELETQVRRALVSTSEPEHRARLAIQELAAWLSREDEALRGLAAEVVARTMPVLKPIPDV